MDREPTRRVYGQALREGAFMRQPHKPSWSLRIGLAASFFAVLIVLPWCLFYRAGLDGHIAARGVWITLTCLASLIGFAGFIGALANRLEFDIPERETMKEARAVTARATKDVVTRDHYARRKRNFWGVASWSALLLFGIFVYDPLWVPARLFGIDFIQNTGALWPELRRRTATLFSSTRTNIHVWTLLIHLAWLGLCGFWIWFYWRRLRDAHADLKGVAAFEEGALRAIDWWRERKDADEESWRHEDLEEVRANLPGVLTEADQQERLFNERGHPFNTADGRYNLAQCLLKQRPDKVNATQDPKKPFAQGGAASWQELADIFEDYHEWRKWRYRMARKISKDLTLIGQKEKAKEPPLPPFDFAYDALDWFKSSEHIRDRKEWEKYVMDNWPLYGPWRRLQVAQDRRQRHTLKNERRLETYARRVLENDPLILGRDAKMVRGLDKDAVAELCSILRAYRDDELERCRFAYKNRNLKRRGDDEEHTLDWFSDKQQEYEEDCIQEALRLTASKLFDERARTRLQGRYTHRMDQLDQQSRDEIGQPIDAVPFDELLQDVNT